MQRSPRAEVNLTLGRRRRQELLAKIERARRDQEQLRLAQEQLRREQEALGERRPACPPATRRLQQARCRAETHRVAGREVHPNFLRRAEALGAGESRAQAGGGPSVLLECPWPDSGNASVAPPQPSDAAPVALAWPLLAAADEPAACAPAAAQAWPALAALPVEGTTHPAAPTIDLTAQPPTVDLTSPAQLDVTGCASCWPSRR